MTHVPWWWKRTGIKWSGMNWEGRNENGTISGNLWSTRMYSDLSRVQKGDAFLDLGSWQREFHICKYSSTHHEYDLGFLPWHCIGKRPVFDCRCWKFVRAFFCCWLKLSHGVGILDLSSVLALLLTPSCLSRFQFSASSFEHQNNADVESAEHKSNRVASERSEQTSKKPERFACKLSGKPQTTARERSGQTCTKPESTSSNQTEPVDEQGARCIRNLSEEISGLRSDKVCHKLRLRIGNSRQLTVDQFQPCVHNSCGGDTWSRAATRRSLQSPKKAGSDNVRDVGEVPPEFCAKSSCTLSSSVSGITPNPDKEEVEECEVGDAADGSVLGTSSSVCSSSHELLQVMRPRPWVSLCHLTRLVCDSALCDGRTVSAREVLASCRCHFVCRSTSEGQREAAECKMEPAVRDEDAVSSKVSDVNFTKTVTKHAADDVCTASSLHSYTHHFSSAETDDVCTASSLHSYTHHFSSVEAVDINPLLCYLSESPSEVHKRCINTISFTECKDRGDINEDGNDTSGEYFEVCEQLAHQLPADIPTIPTLNRKKSTSHTSPRSMKRKCSETSAYPGHSDLSPVDCGGLVKTAKLTEHMKTKQTFQSQFLMFLAGRSQNASGGTPDDECVLHTSSDFSLSNKGAKVTGSGDKCKLYTSSTVSLSSKQAKVTGSGDKCELQASSTFCLSSKQAKSGGSEDQPTTVNEGKTEIQVSTENRKTRVTLPTKHRLSRVAMLRSSKLVHENRPESTRTPNNFGRRYPVSKVWQNAKAWQHCDPLLHSEASVLRRESSPRDEASLLKRGSSLRNVESIFSRVHKYPQPSDLKSSLRNTASTRNVGRTLRDFEISLFHAPRLGSEPDLSVPTASGAEILCLEGTRAEVQERKTGSGSSGTGTSSTGTVGQEQHEHVRVNTGTRKENEHVRTNTGTQKENEHVRTNTGTRKQNELVRTNTGTWKRNEHVGTNTGMWKQNELVTVQTGTQQLNGPVRAHTETQEQKGPVRAYTGTQEQKGPVRARTGTQEQKGPVGARTGTREQKGPVRAHTGTQEQKGPVRAHTGTQEQKGPVRAHTGTQEQKGPVRARALYVPRPCPPPSCWSNGLTFSDGSSNSTGIVRMESSRVRLWRPSQCGVPFSSVLSSHYVCTVGPSSHHLAHPQVALACMCGHCCLGVEGTAVGCAESGRMGHGMVSDEAILPWLLDESKSWLSDEKQSRLSDESQSRLLNGSQSRLLDESQSRLSDESRLLVDVGCMSLLVNSVSQSPSPESTAAAAARQMSVGDAGCMSVLAKSVSRSPSLEPASEAAQQTSVAVGGGCTRTYTETLSQGRTSAPEGGSGSGGGHSTPCLYPLPPALCSVPALLSPQGWWHMLSGGGVGWGVFSLSVSAFVHRFLCLFSSVCVWGGGGGGTPMRVHAYVCAGCGCGLTQSEVTGGGGGGGGRGELYVCISSKLNMQ